MPIRIERQAETKLSAAISMIGSAEITLVVKDDFLGDRQPQALTARPPRIEGGENVLEVFRRETGAAITDLDTDVVAPPVPSTVNRRPNRTELDGVAEQIVKDLLDLPTINRHQGYLFRDGKLQLTLGKQRLQTTLTVPKIARRS